MAEVQIRGLSKQFGRTQVLNKIDLTIQDGEFFTLVGPSGCGKSTLLHILSGLESPTTGEIWFDGAPVGSLPPKDRDVAVVFQSYALYPHMTVYDNLAFPLRMKKKPASDIDRRVKKVAEFLGLAHTLSRKPAELSGGQRQRVALGRAVVREPRLFLLDEPLSNLDAQLRTGMRSELKKLHQALKTTMIYVTHDQAEAMTLSDRMAILHQGTVQQCGPPRSVYDTPRNLFVASFIGSPPMNLLNGTFQGGADPSIVFGRGRGFRIPGVQPGTLMNFKEGQPMVLGIRPEHIHLSKDQKSGGFEATVSLVESIGPELWIEILWGNDPIKLKALPDTDIQNGNTVHFRLENHRIHLYDGNSGLRIEG